jgi:7-cyano-7-deazaguanine synthase
MGTVTSGNQEAWPTLKPTAPLAVLCSGGIDSAVLVAEAVSVYPIVHPLYVRTGATWEDCEQNHLRRFLQSVQAASLRPLVVLDQPIADVYGLHWSMTGAGVPDENSADSAVFLPGRNVLLLAKPLIWCHLHHVPEIAMAPLSANPFPDATPEFFGAFTGAVSVALGGIIRVLRPYAHLTKTQVIQRGRGLALEHTISCIHPANHRHCGCCNKCAERQRAFREAGVPDPTAYAKKSEG